MATQAHTPGRYIGFRALPDRDDDLLDWWDAIPNGERSHILRNLIRAYLNGEITITPEGETPTEFSRDLQLAQIQAEVAWLRQAMMDLPDYLDHLFGKLKVIQMRSEPANTRPDKQISEEQAEQRARAIASRRW